MNTFKVHNTSVPIILYHAEDGDYKGNEWEGYSNIAKVINIIGDHYSIFRDRNVRKLYRNINSVLEGNGSYGGN